MTGALGGYRLTRSRNLKRSKNSETLARVELEFRAKHCFDFRRSAQAVLLPGEMTSRQVRLR